eukprot:6346637-Prymnesium_polylepis.1
MHAGQDTRGRSFRPRPLSTEPRRYTVSAVSRCICAVSVMYLALYFPYGGVMRGPRGHCIAAVSAVSLTRLDFLNRPQATH